MLITYTRSQQCALAGHDKVSLPVWFDGYNIGTPCTSLENQMDSTSLHDSTDSEVIGTTRPGWLSIIVPCFNEEQVIGETNRRLLATAEQSGMDFEILYVDDGSVDGTAEILRQLHAADERVKVLRLSRNFGHQFAITAGLEHASGDAVVLIDADLQDPPEVILQMLARWNEGCWDVVYGTRIDREGESFWKLGTAKLFYRLINMLSDVPIPLDTGDFRLMDRKVVDALLSMPERDRFLRGMVSWLGFRQLALPYHRAARFAGTTKYPMRRMLRFAMDGILSFSVVPLRIATMIGLAASLMALIGCWAALGVRLWTHHWVVGWTSLLLAGLFMGGVQLVCLGVVGEYVGRTYWEAKKRPLYLVQERLGLSAEFTSAPTSARRTFTHR
jgi:dolichol-phosphate mannosyltransferase